MTDQEFSKFCQEHDLKVIDTDIYKNASYEEANEFFGILQEVLNATKEEKSSEPYYNMLKNRCRLARKYDKKEKRHSLVAVPAQATFYERDLNTKIACASCGKKIIYGSSYTSGTIFDFSGFGYAICRECCVREVTGYLERSESNVR